MKHIFIYISLIITGIVAVGLPAAAPEVHNLQIVSDSQSPGMFADVQGKPIGLMVDVVTEIQRRLGTTDQIQLLPWTRALHMAKIQPNVVILSLARTPEREDLFHWVTLVMRKPWVLYAKRGAGITVKTLDDAKKVKSIVVERADIRADWLKSKGFTNLEEVNDTALNIKKLLAGHVSLIFTSPQDASQWCQQLGVKMNDLEPVLFPNFSLSYIAMSRNGTSMEIVKKWQETAQQIKDDGTFRTFAEKWAQYTQKQLNVECHVKDGALNFWP
jgi:polar amino acid transport system substrate-binding protein